MGPPTVHGQPPPPPPPGWFWAVLIAGMVVRIYLAVFTEGTYDVGIWQEHAEGVQKYGLVGYYHLNEGMNHPPFISLAISTLARLGPITGIPFRVLFRAPFIAVD